MKRPFSTVTMLLALCGLLAVPGVAHAGMTYGQTVPALQLGQSWVYGATADQPDIDALQLVFYFNAPVGSVYHVSTMPYDASKPEDDTVFRQISTGVVIDDDHGQNRYCSAYWARDKSADYGFNISGFSASLKNLRVVVTRVK